MKLNLKEVHEISSTNSVEPYQALIKTQEELGEFSSAFLNYINANNKSASSEPNVLEEGTDVLMCIIDTLFKLGFSAENIQDELDKKCKKWQNKIKGCKQ